MLTQKNFIIKNMKYQRKKVFLKNASKNILNLKIGLAINKTYDDVFDVGNLKHFIMYMFSK